MNNSINLSSYKQKNTIYYQKQVKIVRAVSIGMLVVTVLLASSFFVLNINSQLPVLQKEQSTVMTNLRFLQKKAVEIQLLHDRTAFIATILANRNSYDTMMTDIESLLGNDITLTRVAITKKSVILSLTSSSLISLRNFLDTFSTKVDKKQFAKLTINEISADGQSGLFSVSIQADTL